MVSMITHKKVGRRTMIFEEDLHVGTVFEIARPSSDGPGIYQWYVAQSGGRSPTLEAALEAIEEELER